MCVYVLDYIFLHLNSRKERKKLSGQRHNLWNTKHTHTRAHTRIHTRILSRILTNAFVELAYSSSLCSLAVASLSSSSSSWIAFGACFVCLLAPFAAAQRTKLAAFLVSQAFSVRRRRRYTNLMEFFFLCFVLAPRLVSAYLFYKFSTHTDTHTCTRIYTYLLLLIKCCCCGACKTKRFLINVLQPMWERDGDSLCFLYSQSFSLSYTNCGRINMLDRYTKSKKHPGTVSLLSVWSYYK